MRAFPAWFLPSYGAVRVPVANDDVRFSAGPPRAWDSAGMVSSGWGRSSRARRWLRPSVHRDAGLAALAGLAIGLVLGGAEWVAGAGGPEALVVEAVKACGIALLVWFLFHRLTAWRLRRVGERLSRIAGPRGMPAVPKRLNPLTQLEIGAVLMLRRLRRSIHQARNRQLMIDLLIDSAPDGILALRPDQTIARANRAVESLFGYAEGGLVGRKLDDLLPERMRDAHRAMTAQFAAGPDGSGSMAPGRLVTGCRRDGTEIKVSISIGKASIQGYSVLIAIVRDLSGLEEARLTAEKAAADALSAARQAALADRSKTEFLAHMSHELRTPLNGIIGFAEMMQLEAFGSLGHPKYREYVDDIHGSGQHLLSLLGDILDVSRLDLDIASQGPVARPTDLSPLVHAVARSFREQVSASMILNVTGFDAPRRVLASDRAVRQVLLNLIANACRFADQENGIVAIRAIEGNDGLIGFEMRDNGPGFSQEVLDRFGTPFNTGVDSEVSNARAGTGLGLYICKRIVEGLEGQIRLYNGEGAVACVYFRPAQGAGAGTKA